MWILPSIPDQTKETRLRGSSSFKGLELWVPLPAIQGAYTDSELGAHTKGPQDLLWRYRPSRDPTSHYPPASSCILSYLCTCPPKNKKAETLFRSVAGLDPLEREPPEKVPTICDYGLGNTVQYGIYWYLTIWYSIVEYIMVWYNIVYCGGPG